MYFFSICMSISASAAAAPIHATPGVSSVSDPPYLHMLVGNGNPLNIPHHKDIPVEVAGKFKCESRKLSYFHFL